MSEQDPAETAFTDQRDAAANDLSSKTGRILGAQGFQQRSGSGSRASEAAHARWDAWTAPPREERDQCEHVDLDAPTPMLLVGNVLYCYPCGSRVADARMPPSTCDSCGAGFALIGRVNIVQQLGQVAFPLDLCPSCAGT